MLGVGEWFDLILEVSPNQNDPMINLLVPPLANQEHPKNQTSGQGPLQLQQQVQGRCDEDGNAQPRAQQPEQRVCQQLSPSHGLCIAPRIKITALERRFPGMELSCCLGRGQGVFR